MSAPRDHRGQGRYAIAAWLLAAVLLVLVAGGAAHG
jgi:ABC-type microcin C transport system permease subunit YejB